MSPARAIVAGILLAACSSTAAKDQARADESSLAAAVADASEVGDRASSASVSPTLERREYWRAVVREQSRLPRDRTAAQFALELEPWLASTDPELRDDLAYTILSGWIVRGAIEDVPLRELASKWRADLSRPGTTDEDVLARSFAALTLASVVARELKHPFLGEELPRIRAAALEYAAREQDVRGYDDRLGWMHATAHTADLLKFLARDLDLPIADQAAFLAVIDGKAALGASWSAGEDLRLARVVLSLVNRADFDVSAFEAWVARYETAYRDLWSGPRVDARRLTEFGNRRRVLAELNAILPVDGDIEERHVIARERVQRALRATG